MFSVRILRVYAAQITSSYRLLLMRRASHTSVSKMASILERLRTLPPVEQRRAAAMLGAVVADAAITPLHWIYDQEKVAKLVSSGTAEFSPTSHCPFYTVAAGEPSAYGAAVHITLREIAENKGFDAKKMGDRIFKFFGEGTPYESTRKQTTMPKQGPWTNRCIKTFLAKRESGEKPETDPDGPDPDGLLKSIAIIGAYHGKAELLDKVEECVKVTQSNRVAVGYALAGARLLNNVVATGNDALDQTVTELKDSGHDHPYETDVEVVEAIQKARSAASKTHPEAVKEFGLACGMPPSFLGMIHGAAVATDYKSAVRSELLAAGDNCSRVSFIGAYAAARFGLDSIPSEWVLKVNGIEQILTDIETIVKL